MPHQICHYHYLKDVAQPVCEADRHFKKELKKKVRGIREIERQAAQAPSKEAQRVADYCLAIRTVMRDDGLYPLEPPGLQLCIKKSPPPVQERSSLASFKAHRGLASR